MARRLPSGRPTQIREKVRIRRRYLNFGRRLPALYQHGSGPAGQAGNTECGIKNLRIESMIYILLQSEI
jgi:hypothetical protein